ncbi:unnamed protein product [Phaedon cochleariae]|uniref:Uncharacterized protein n=1 Tax=Phaedon cochleariae TaxID=80249 RepID=A0A9N9SI57_PHACE|nr:unnamed protein product [Phaedon cochleariae]
MLFNSDDDLEDPTFIDQVDQTDPSSSDDSDGYLNESIRSVSRSTSTIHDKQHDTITVTAQPQQNDAVQPPFNPGVDNLFVEWNRENVLREFPFTKINELLVPTSEKAIRIRKLKREEFSSREEKKIRRKREETDEDERIRAKRDEDEKENGYRIPNIDLTEVKVKQRNSAGNKSRKTIKGFEEDNYSSDSFEYYATTVREKFEKITRSKSTSPNLILGVGDYVIVNYDDELYLGIIKIVEREQYEIIEFINEICNSANEDAVNDFADRATHSNTHPFTINGHQFGAVWNDTERNTFLRPGLLFEIETDHDLDKKFRKYGRRLNIPTIAANTRTQNISEFTQLNNPHWFVHIIEIMTIYCSYFDG